MGTLGTDNQHTISFNSRDTTVRSTHSSPLRTPTVSEHSLVDETRKSVKCLFDSIEGPGDSSTVVKTGESSSIAGEGPSSSALAGKQDMDGLLSVEVNPLVWCKKYSVNFPYLAQITCRYLVIPSTTAPVERLFSVSGQVLTVKRNRLSLKQ